MFEQELALALRAIAAAPHAGKRYPHRSGRVRRVVMRATRNHVYCVEEPDHVLVVAVWGGVKSGGPDLSEL